MAPSAELVALVDKIPPLDSKDYKPPLLKTRPSTGKFTGPTWAEAEKIIEPILKGGTKSLVGVIDMLQEVDDGTDYKARYVLHAIAQYACRADKQEAQDLMIDALAGALDGRPVEIQKFLLQQLRVCGDGRLAKRLGKLLTNEKLCDRAALALTAIKTGAVEQFRAALGKATGRCRLVALQNLGVLGDKGSVGAFRKAATDTDVDIRVTAVWALADLGDAESVDVVLKAAGSKNWERVRAVKACLLLAEKLAAAGKKDDAKKIYTHLRDTRTDKSENYVRQVATKALEAL